MTRHLLLAVAGTTPATVTEAAFALAVAQKIPLSHIQVLTTEEGRNRIEGPLDRQLGEMRRAYPGATLPPAAEFRIFPMKDIVNSEDNDRLADWVLEQVREACTQDDVVLHASIAGGRKTMSFYLGAALQLLGRPQDKLYHVLVPKEYEHPDFFFPGAGEPDPISLAELPWVPLRGVLGEAERALKFRQLVARAADAVATDSYLHVHVEFGDPHRNRPATIRFRKHDTKGLSKEEAVLEYASAGSFAFAVVAWLLHRTQQGKPLLSFSSRKDVPNLVAEFNDWSSSIGEPAGGHETARNLSGLYNSATRMRTGKERVDPVESFIAEEWLPRFEVQAPRFRKRLKAAFAEQLPDADPSKYEIKTNGACDYHFTIPPDHIHFHFPDKRATR